MRWFDPLLDVLFPRSCLACGRDLCGGPWPWLCPACLARIEPPPPFPCPVCAGPLGPFAMPSACASCRRLRPRFDACVAAGGYEGTLGELVVRMKYGKDADLAWPLGELLADTLRLWAPLREVDVVVPVPMRFMKRVRRGFNQSEALAAEVARRLSLHLYRFVLRRGRAGPAQAGLTLAKRLVAQRRSMVV
ncbi:MAG: ComF family protein, partial [Planctomycetes bacterium]|nr:ComF family protein [Planctomycetota bacterium]